MWPADGAGDDDDDVAEREADEWKAAAVRRADVIQAPASATDVRPLRQARTARRDAAAGVGSASTATEDPDDSGRCNPTTEVSDCCRAQTPAQSPTTLPSTDTVGRRTVGRDVASTTMAENKVPDRPVRRYRGQSLPRSCHRRRRCQRSESIETCLSVPPRRTGRQPCCRCC